MPTRPAVRLPLVGLVAGGMGAACAAGLPARHGDPPLQPLTLVALASEFRCATGRWPRDAAELESFSPPRPSRLDLEADREAVPWERLRRARFDPRPDGSLLVTAELPAGGVASVAGGSPARPVDLRLRVGEPGCWPP